MKSESRSDQIEDNVDLVPRYRLKDFHFSALHIQAEKVDCWKVQGGEKGEDREAVHVDHSPDRRILELAAAQHPRALALLVQHPADPVRLHHLKLHHHWRLLGGETHIDRVHPGIEFDKLIQFIGSENVFVVLECSFLDHIQQSTFPRFLLLSLFLSEVSVGNWVCLHKQPCPLVEQLKHQSVAQLLS